jgi:hypothetical protein
MLVSKQVIPQSNDARLFLQDEARSNFTITQPTNPIITIASPGSNVERA